MRCGSILAWRWLNDALNDPRATINAVCNRSDLHAEVVSITWREGNKWASLFGAQAWGDGATVSACQVHSDALTYLNVGTYASPSALGQATIRAHLNHWQTTLPLPCQRDLLANLNGGRAELLAPGTYPVAFELDRRMAYVSESTQPLPIGAPVWIGACGPDILSRYPIWYGLCTVIVPSPLGLGSFPFRTESGRLTFPTEPGLYSTWLWSPEVDDTLNAGCFVAIERGWAWEKGEPVLEPWGHFMYDKRMNAPDERVAEYVKRAAVAGLGAFAMRGKRLKVQLESDDTHELPIVNAAGLPTRYVAVPDPKARPSPIMPHWASLINAMARRTLYHEQLALGSAGNRVLASDFDSVLVRDSTGTHSSALGEWRERELTNLVLTVPRHLRSDQKTKTPGVPHAR